MKGSAKKFFFTIVIIVLSFVLITYFAGPYIVCYSIPSIVKEFYQRELVIGKFRYNPFKCTILLEKVNLSDKNESLICFDSFFVDINLLKTLSFSPTISQIKLDGFQTYFDKFSDFDYRLPEYIKKTNSTVKKESNSNELKIPNINFAIQDISITNCNILLNEYSGTKYKKRTILSNGNLILPGITSSKNQQLSPEFNGFILDKKFNIQASTSFQNDEFVSSFDINFEKFDIKDIAMFIPEIEHVKVLEGFVTAKCQLSFVTSKHKKPYLGLTCLGTLANGKCFDSKLQKVLVQSLTGSFKIEKYDILAGNLLFDYINVTSGKAFVDFSQNSNKSTCFLSSNSKNGGDFEFGLKNLTVKNATIVVNDFDRNQIFPIVFSNFKMQNIFTYQKTPWQFDATFSISQIVDQVSLKGNFNVNTFDFDTQNIKIVNCIPNNLKFLSALNFDLKCSLLNFSGKAKFFDNKFVADGVFDLKNCEYQIEYVKCLCKELFIDIPKIDYDVNKSLDIDCKKISLVDANLTVEQSFSLQNFNAKFNDIAFTYFKEKNNTIKLNKTVTIDEIKGLYTKSLPLYFDVFSVSFDKKTECRFDSNSLDLSGMLNLKKAKIKTEEKIITQIENAKIDVDSFDFKKNVLNINQIIVDKPKAVVDIKNDGKLYLLSILPLEFSNNGQTDSFSLNLDECVVNNGIIKFTDYSIGKPFELEISNLTAKMKNFPSFVYPQGNLEFEGIINNRNKILVDTKIGKTGLDGVVKTQDLSLLLLTSYFEKYIGYQVLAGNLAVDGKFVLKNNKLDTNFALQIKDFALQKQKNLFPSDLSKIIPLLQDSSKIIKLNIPVKGDYNNPNIDFRKLFFSIFYDLLDNSQSRLTVASSGSFVRDGTYEMLYFNAGTDSFSMSPTKFFSDLFKENISNKEKYYVIEVYVDKKIDKQVLLDKKISQMCENICGFIPVRGGKEYRECLIQIYKNLFGVQPNENDSTEFIYQNILSKMTVENSDYLSLSYRRATSIRKFLVENFQIDDSHISISEENIFENPYINGVSNTLGFVISGKMK